jgi:hypothetical protein
VTCVASLRFVVPQILFERRSSNDSASAYFAARDDPFCNQTFHAAIANREEFCRPFYRDTEGIVMDLTSARQYLMHGIADDAAQYGLEGKLGVHV